MLAAVIGAILLLLFSLWLFNHMNRKHNHEDVSDDLFEQKKELLAACQLRVENSERRNLEQRAKVSLVNSITPFIDRILYEASHSGNPNISYIQELTDQINAYNDVLTYWIQLRQGELSLKIESFSLQQLFDIISRGKTGFQMKGVDLQIEPTESVVKADRVLTLFMLNTLADNARKFTEKGGEVKVSATEGEQYVEIAVEDTGNGMTEEQLAHLFDHKIVEGHGFGLLNCKGIIEKYRKISQIFSVCSIAATSQLGKGTRLFFRLPKGVLRLILVLLSFGCLTAQAQGLTPLEKANAFADSAYFSNINGTFERTMQFADSCRYYLNVHYKSLNPKGRDLMLAEGDASLTFPEIRWFHDSVKTNYTVILDIRNESAVAALALHQWHLYNYNNRIYTQLFKEMSADNSLGEYCRAMQQSQTNKTVGVILLVLLLVSIVPAWYLLYYRHRLYDRFMKDQQRETEFEMLDDEIRRMELEDNNLHVTNAVLDNCLSTLKHETMYYPSRICQLLDAGDMASLAEVATYYRELYGILSAQAMHQVAPIKLHLKPLQHGILGDENLVRYLFEILKKQSGEKHPDIQYLPQDGPYVEIHIPMPQLKLTEEQAHELFTPSKDHLPYLLCRQIIRDHGEATNRRGCGIYATLIEGITNMIITLPSVWRISK